MEDLVGLIPEGGSLVAIIVVVALFLRSLEKMQGRYEQSLAKISEEHKQAVKALLDRITFRKAG